MIDRMEWRTLKRQPREVCFLLGSNGQYYLDRGMGRKVDADEALQVLAQA